MNKTRLLLLSLVPIVGAAFYLRSLASWRPKEAWRAQGPISRLVFSNDGKTLLVSHTPLQTGFYSGPIVPPATIITALDVQNGFKPLWERKHIPLGRAPQFFNHDSQILLQGGNVQFLNNLIGLQILDARTGKTQKDYGHRPGEATISPDGKWLAYKYGNDPIGNSATDGRIYLNPTLPTMLNKDYVADKIIGRRNGSSPTFSFAPDGKTFAVGIGDTLGTSINFYDTSTWKLVRTWKGPGYPGLGTSPYYLTLRWSRDGQSLLSCAQKGSRTALQLWRVSDGKKLSAAALPDSLFFGSPFSHTEADGRVLTCSNDRKVLLGQPPILNTRFDQLLYIPNGLISTATLSPDGSSLVAGTQLGQLFLKRVQ